MRIFKVLFLVLFISSCLANSIKQDPYFRHTIEKGETVYSISKKYNVTPFDIYRLNPDAKDGIKENTTLLIPSKTTLKSNNEDEEAEVTHHVVKPKETLYSLAKQYGVSVADLKEWNPTVEKEGLKIGQEIVVSKTYKPSAGTDVVSVKEIKSKTEFSNHVVKTGETLFSLSKQYNISIDYLKALNPQLKDGLKISDTLKIKKEKKIEVTQTSATKYYTVKQSETLYSISKQFNVSEEVLTQLNPELNFGLKEGMLLKMPENKVVFDTVSNKNQKLNKHLLQTVDFDSQKELVILLPFNLRKMEADSTKSYKDYIKNSKFLNLTLDFYSGALVAIDSAKSLGLPVRVRILDVEESSKSSNVSQIITRNNFSNVDAVIGPFYNANAEVAAQLLAKYNIPLISPLSKELSKPISNLYNAVPSKEHLNAALMNYLLSKEGNIVAVISQKKNASKEYLQNNYSTIKFPLINEKGSFTIEAIRKELVKGKKNFVILDSEQAGQIMNVTSHLMKLKDEFDIQLVVFEIYDTLDYEEIKMEHLTSLNLLYPSVSKEATSVEELLAIKKLTQANKLSPNYYVVKGFDLTLDTMLRICQKESFSETVKVFSSEGVESGFNYVNENGTWVNKAIYIQFFDNDYTIKTAE